jgi:hypothetical protein
MPAGAIDLTTVAKVQLYLAVPSGTEDSLFQDVVTAASRLFYSYTGAPVFAAASATEIYDGQGGYVLRLKRFPINSITSLVIDGQTVPASVNNSLGYIINQEKTAIKLIGYCFNRGYGNVVVNYNGGTSTVPEDVEYSVRETVAHWYRQKKFIGQMSEAIQGATAAYDKIDVPRAARTIWNIYKVKCPL